MRAELVIDTNVLAHAALPTEARNPESLKLIEWMIGSSTLLCVDTGFSLVESENRSVIGSEYIKHLRYGSPGLHLISHLAQSGRLRICEKRGTHAEGKLINQLVRKPCDRTFLGVACNSNGRTLVSHDFEDFQRSKRKQFKREIGLIIIEAKDVLQCTG